MESIFVGDDVVRSESEVTHETLVTLATAFDRGDCTYESWSVARSLVQALIADDAEHSTLLSDINEVFSSGSLPPAEHLSKLLARLDHMRPLRVFTSIDPHVREREWIIPQWLPAGRVALFTGDGGIGKSRLVLMLLAGMAAGIPGWIGGDEQSSTSLALSGNVATRVMIASWEDEHEEISRRLMRAASADVGYAPAEWCTPEYLGERLIFVDMAGEGPLWGPEHGRHVSTSSGLTTTGRQLRLLAEQHEVSLLVIDPLAAAYGGDENTRGLVRSFMSSFDAWARKTGCAVLLVAHPPKSSGQSYSGSTDWQAAARTLWLMAPSKTHGADLVLSCEKANYAPPPRPVLLQRESPEAPDGFWSATGFYVASADQQLELSHARSKYDR